MQQENFRIWFDKQYLFRGRNSDFVVWEDTSVACQQALQIGRNFVNKYFQATGAIKNHQHIPH